MKDLDSGEMLYQFMNKAITKKQKDEIQIRILALFLTGVIFLILVFSKGRLIFPSPKLSIETVPYYLLLVFISYIFLFEELIPKTRMLFFSKKAILARFVLGIKSLMDIDLPVSLEKKCLQVKRVGFFKKIYYTSYLDQNSFEDIKYDRLIILDLEDNRKKLYFGSYVEKTLSALFLEVEITDISLFDSGITSLQTTDGEINILHHKNLQSEFIRLKKELLKKSQD